MGKETYDQTQKVAENRNSLCDNPRNDPEAESDCDPGADGDPVTFVHAIGAAEESYVYVFEGNVSVDDSCDDDLGILAIVLRVLGRRHTVGRAMP